MPKATANTLAIEHHDLKSLPGAFVEVRRLTYGETLQRRDFMVMEMTGDKSNARAEMALGNRKATQFDFQKCIVGHNLFADEEETRKLNLGNPADLELLDPRVGQEIEQLLDRLNNFDLDAEGNSSNGSVPSSSSTAQQV